MFLFIVKAGWLQQCTVCSLQPPDLAGYCCKGVDCVVHMGDIMDGKQLPEARAPSLDTLVAEFNKLGRPHYHLIGNHDLYNFSREVHLAML